VKKKKKEEGYTFAARKETTPEFWKRDRNKKKERESDVKSIPGKGGKGSGGR